MSSSGDDGTSALELMDRATSGIREADSFSSWVRNAGIGTIIISFVVAISEGVLTFGDGLFATLGSISDGLARLIDGTIGAGVRVIDAGSAAAVNSFLDGAAAFLGPAAYPVAVGSVVAAIWILSRGYQEFNPLEWFGGLKFWGDD